MCDLAAWGRQAPAAAAAAAKGAPSGALPGAAAALGLFAVPVVAWSLYTLNATGAPPLQNADHLQGHCLVVGSLWFIWSDPAGKHMRQLGSSHMGQIGNGHADSNSSN